MYEDKIEGLNEISKSANLIFESKIQNFNKLIQEMVQTQKAKESNSGFESGDRDGLYYLSFLFQSPDGRIYQFKQRAGKDFDFRDSGCVFGDQFYHRGYFLTDGLCAF